MADLPERPRPIHPPYSDANPHDPATCPYCAPVMAHPAWLRGEADAQANAKAALT